MALPSPVVRWPRWVVVSSKRLPANPRRLTNVTNSGTFIGGNGSITTLAGTISNTGTMSFNSTVNTTSIVISGNVMLTGSGTVTLDSNDAIGNGAGGTLTNVNNTIQGETDASGSIGFGDIGIVNQASGVIDANVSGKALVVEPGATGLTNTGNMEATNNGILRLSGSGGGTFTNTGGTIQALTGSQVQLTAGASITGGTLATAGTGMIVNNDTASLASLTNSGAFVGSNGSFTTIAGTITNNGTMALNGTANGTALLVNTAATLAGSGTLTLTTFDAVGGTGTLTNNSTIQGQTNSGGIGSGQIALVNNGLIDANVSGQTLVVNPTAFTNNANGIAPRDQWRHTCV